MEVNAQSLHMTEIKGNQRQVYANPEEHRVNHPDSHPLRFGETHGNEVGVPIPGDQNGSPEKQLLPDPYVGWFRAILGPVDQQKDQVGTTSLRFFVFPSVL